MVRRQKLLEVATRDLSGCTLERGEGAVGWAAMLAIQRDHFEVFKHSHP
jgi:hypothetical protein